MNFDIAFISQIYLKMLGRSNDLLDFRIPRLHTAIEDCVENFDNFLFIG